MVREESSSTKVQAELGRARYQRRQVPSGGCARGSGVAGGVMSGKEINQKSYEGLL